MRPLIAVLFLMASTGAAAAQTGDAQRGRETYNQMGCWQCHGYEGQGGGAGPRVGPDALPWTPFSNYVRSPRGSMPPYSERVLTDEHLADIHAYLRGLPPPNPTTRQLGRDLQSSSPSRR